ncbi:transposase [Virgibacillus sp. 179-BFC.A HS]|uniref:Transposase n=1 Tax=Tigheibacillus jepli TaxID=3035914 RepID=A0ABU5CGV3_9BACI|nr:transposase [Virgibacillus sp. 179-BFC.A HS]MDY0405191.1 transposase [Virgibacillus sp. 179-BFC.A HS]
MNKLFCGIDIGLNNFQFHAMDQDGNAIGKNKRYSNNIPGMNRLVDDLGDLMDKRDNPQLFIGMEATGLYWFPLLRASGK